MHDQAVESGSGEGDRQECGDTCADAARPAYGGGTPKVSDDTDKAEQAGLAGG
jgi:hypothetical protein